MDKISDSHIHAVLVKKKNHFHFSPQTVAIFFLDKRELILCINNLNFAAKTVFVAKNIKFNTTCSRHVIFKLR